MTRRRASEPVKDRKGRGCVVSQWDGSSVRFRPDIHTLYSLVCSPNPRLHDEVLRAPKGITPLKGFSP